MFSPSTIEDFERDIEHGEIEVSPRKTGTVLYTDRIRAPIKKPETDAILKWKPLTSYGNKPIIFHESDIDYIVTIEGLPFESFFDEEKLLAFKGDPEDENFVPISKETLERVKQFLTPLFIMFPAGSCTPRILPGPDGSVDIHWKSPQKELLINVPADKGAPVPFYGDDYGKLSIKGTIETNSLHPAVLMWLINS